MGMKQVRGTKRPVNYRPERKTNAKDPMVLIGADGIAQLNVRCRDLLAVTAVTTKKLVDQVVAAAESVQNPEKWTKEDVAAVCQKLGRMPHPTAIAVDHLEREGSLLLRVATIIGPNVAELSYRKGSSRPYFNALPALKEHSIKVPAGMCLALPVALVMDNGQLKVEVNLRHGKERAVNQ